ncbi:MAG: type IX secretion system plug protein domain-containing protein [bacterium]
MQKVILLFLLPIVSIFAQDFEIKSLHVYSDNETAAPMLFNNNGKTSGLTIEFDIRADYEPNLVILFKFCDRNWRPYDGLFLNNSGMNRTPTIWFDRLPLVVRGVQYHYKGNFPSEYVSFPFSGKWKFFIVESNDYEKIFWTGKFYVVSNIIDLKSSITKDKLDAVTPSNYHSRALRIQTDFLLPDSLHNTRVEGIEIVRNREIENATVVSRNDNSNSRYYEWNGTNKFSFIARDILPGNEYRVTDIRNKERFYPPETQAHLDGIELSRFYKYGPRDHNGAFILTNFNDDNSEYMDVLFQLRPPEINYDKDIFLVGSFTDWEVLPEFQLKNNEGLYSLYVELKRGIYDYQYVTANLFREKFRDIDTIELEGNFWETENEFYIFLYYKSPLEGGYDQIIGFTKILSRGL